MKHLIMIAAIGLTGCATISQEIVTTTNGITQKCQLDAKGYLGSAESILTCKSYDVDGNYIAGSDTVSTTKMGMWI